MLHLKVKNTYDDVGGTVKHMEERTSLSNQILTPRKLFEFAETEIAGVIVFCVDSESVDETLNFLEPRFSKYSKKTHQFWQQNLHEPGFCNWLFFAVV